jgi:hypothetical protein
VGAAAVATDWDAVRGGWSWLVEAAGGGGLVVEAAMANGLRAESGDEEAKCAGVHGENLLSWTDGGRF